MEVPTAEKRTVVIIGAGISGLACANSLKAAGIDCIILEARNRIGGRLHTVFLEGAFGEQVPVDIGGSWIHGGPGNPLFDKAQSLGLQFKPGYAPGASVNFDYTGSYSRGEYNQARKVLRAIHSHMHRNVIPSMSKEKLIASSMNDGWQMGLQDKPEKYRDSTTKSCAYLNFLRAGQEQYEGADMCHLALDQNCWGYISYGGDCMLEAGYSTLLNILARGIDIRLNDPVVSIDERQSGHVLISTKSGKKYSSNYCVITLPLGVLQHNDVVFQPPLPSWKTDSLSRMGMGLMNKVILQFEKAFWDHKASSILYVSKTKGEYRFSITVNQNAKKAILMCFTAAEFAKNEEEFTDEECVEHLMTIFRKKYGNGIPQPSFYKVTRWLKDPYSRGSYSYFKAGSTPTDISNSGKRVRNLFFAGEHTCPQGVGCAHGGYMSGIRVFQSIFQCTKQ